ncbi:MAG: DNA phosphorothioation-dependent restriction protein DptH [Amphibacillus sp.]|nr:DNA phosphorothioation-dependent restriction protein DptH [Amphibacillus sp.]
MSSQFYNYIADLITEYVGNNGRPGDRFYIQLESQSEVDQLVDALSQHDDIVNFSYQHEFGEPYETVALAYPAHKLIVANTSSKVKPDFLVKLRNLVGEQEDGFEKTSLLSIVSEQLDSIEGGSSNLQKEGMPLHPDSIFESLDERIDNSNLSSEDKVILKNNLSYLLNGEPFQQITIFDFVNIFTTLIKGSIEKEEFYKFGLFIDSDIATFSKKKQEQRLQDNRELFDYVKRVHDYGHSKEELEKYFSDAGVKELSEKDWYSTSYSAVNQFREDHIKLNKDIKVVLDELTVKKLEHWDKSLNERAAGKRKRQIIIFNPEQVDEIELTISFAFTGNVTSLSDEFLTFGKQSVKHLEVDAKRKNLHVKVKTREKESVFVNFGYKHNKKVALGAEFFIAVLPIDSSYIEQYKTQYVVNVRRQAIELKYEGNKITLGSGFQDQRIDLEKYNQTVEMPEVERLILRALPEAFDDHDELMFNINVQNKKIPFLLTNELPESTPITGQRIRRLIRENGKNMEWIRENNRLVMGNQEFYFNPEYEQFFKWEDEIIVDGIRFATFEANTLIKEDIKLGLDLRESYNKLINYFMMLKLIPSLAAFTDDLKERATDYINEYIKEIESFKDGLPAGERGIDLFKLGTVKSQNKIYLTPLHPLMLAYRMEYFENLKTEELNNSILNRLTPEALMPFIYDANGLLYKPEYSHSAPEWLEFKDVNEVSVSNANQYLARIVQDKIEQFRTHFSYLFMETSAAPFKISVVNIVNDFEVIKGILSWMIDSIDFKSNKITPVEITLYNTGNQESALDRLSTIDNAVEFKAFFDLNLRKRDLDEEDVLRLIRENISFYKNNKGANYNYAHITFYKMEEEEKTASQPMQNMFSGLALDGLYSSVPSMKDNQIYLSGFGVKTYDCENHNLLTKAAYYTNELAANVRNSGNNSYRKGEAIYSWTKNKDESILQDIFSASHWVTFVDPSIDLEFFNKFDENLIVIHYSDQYSSSSRYDAITVTNKSDQYYAVIKEFLEQKEVEGTTANVRNTVKAFNMFNGEWLLRIIGSKGYSSKEKLSIISAIKYAVSYLEHPNILWVPISLEEVLRVAGAVGLSQADGVFTAKNLGVRGAHSDDLLLIGLEQSEDKILLHFYPVEVKIGINANAVIDKGKVQVIKTKKLLLDSLTGEVGATFAGKFYRNFFVQLFIANARALHSNGFWKAKGYDLSDEIIERLLKSDYEVSNKLMRYIGEGAVLSFRKDAIYRSAGVENDILLINLAEDDGFKGLVEPLEKLCQWVQVDSEDLIKETMLSHSYIASGNRNSEHDPSGNLTTDDAREEYQSNGDSNGNNSEQVEVIDDRRDLTEKPSGDFEREADNEPRKVPEDVEEPERVEITVVDDHDRSKEEAAPTTMSLEQARFLLGTIENSNAEVYWEYGHKGLANRHLLISGKSGQGKTYFMQCLLLEASQQGIPNIVIDYTEGFLPNQLEREFTDTLGDKIHHKIVYHDNFPINPFKPNMRDIGGIQLLETATDVAERIRSVFSAVYGSLGIQQLNAIYEATNSGIEKYGDQMNLIKLREILEEDNSSYAKTALSQIRPLIDRNPFDIHNTVNWKDYIESDGEVLIVQLTGFNREVQLIITEFILWDLWNYSVRHGDKTIPIPVILDEAQNLDHREKSPSARILTEGRKFGWSAWYATQFLKAQLSTDELARLQNSSQKIYFAPPEEEISNIAAGLTKDTAERREWERKLASLKKGQCIVHGPMRLGSGELSPPQINIVNITSLGKRLENM